MRLALVGQPNCGKSTLFNQVAGYKAETGNFSGTTVKYTATKIRLQGKVVELVDLPGTYTLLGTNPAERVVLDYLAANKVDAIINVIDATHLAQGLALSLELLELQLPIVVAVNMMDEAIREGIRINGPKLEHVLGVPVLPMVATRGQGVRAVFNRAYSLSKDDGDHQRPAYSPEIEQEVQRLSVLLDNAQIPISASALAIKLLEGDPGFTDRLTNKKQKILAEVKQSLDRLCHATGRQAMWLISTERHDKATQIASQVVKRGERHFSLRDRLDDILLHPLWGYICLLLIMLVFFGAVYGIGNMLEGPLLAAFGNIEKWVISFLNKQTLWAQMVVGAVQGVAGGLAIVLPYLTPFLIGLGLMEDIGYLTRIAFLMDAFMHKIGLHGKAIVPFILGYGCNVPAIMSTRIMEEKRDRFLAAALSTMIPCAARLSVVFGLVAFYLGPFAALGIYAFNIVVIALTGRIMTHFIPEDTPGMILEMPVYRLPTLKTVTAKAWFRIREFVFEAWPILIIGSVVLAVLNFYQIARYFDALIRPITWLLDLPSEVGTPLIFGIFRKELSMVMLGQALGTTDFASVLSPLQMISYTIFVVFYIPCIATIITIKNELDTRAMLGITVLTIVVALLAAVLARLTLLPFF